ncbi:TIGR02587 family membrane protein [Pelagerythrobacter rhizovicinus]|uniref:TIGR02587 family membrane protein n=1 Tax=Pelagerythrobacter rhizovicinus TaxID=2268576 RepID=A0A4V1QW15_9SPHN|nr:TIGR02587 family membrane protein [Pelagerythrobacter rhizovicinus]RXZ64576.1 TIGR02587 family membrane protein [Pelagerythrobacter rhizovicinus]
MASQAANQHPNREYAVELARAFGGAIIFGLPNLMTMEMWFLGFYLDRPRLILFLLVNFAILMGLSRFSGFEETASVKEDLLDALAAYGVGVIASAATLAIFGILLPGMSMGEIVGKIAVQSVPASFGAIIARQQMRGKSEEEQEEERDVAERRGGYGWQLFLMVAGALFLAFNLAPTEEMVLIGFKMSPWHAVALVLVSVLALHAFVYAVGFAGQERPPEGSGFWRLFVCYTIAGYGVALLVSLYVLWTFGRMDGADLGQIASMTAVLAFPAAIGAAIARLVV